MSFCVLLIGILWLNVMATLVSAEELKSQQLGAVFSQSQWWTDEKHKGKAVTGMRIWEMNRGGAKYVKNLAVRYGDTWAVPHPHTKDKKEYKEITFAKDEYLTQILFKHKSIINGIVVRTNLQTYGSFKGTGGKLIEIGDGSSRLNLYLSGYATIHGGQYVVSGLIVHYEQAAVEVDACLTDNGGCEHECVNTDGEPLCECRTGYILRTDEKSCAECPSGFSQVGNKYCYINFNSITNKAGAVSFCATMNARLPILDDMEQLQLLLNWITDSQKNRYWMGLSRETRTDPWLWENGSSFNSTLWGPGEPDDNIVKYHENTAVLVNGIFASVLERRRDNIHTICQFWGVTED